LCEFDGKWFTSDINEVIIDVTAVHIVGIATDFQLPTPDLCQCCDLNETNIFTPSLNTRDI